MMKTLMAQFGNRATTRFDVVIGVVAAVMAIGHAVDTAKQYKSQQDPNATEENDQ